MTGFIELSFWRIPQRIHLQHREQRRTCRQMPGRNHSLSETNDRIYCSRPIFSLALSLSVPPPPLSEAIGKPLLSTKYDQTHGIIGFINMPKYNLVKCISGRDNHLQLLRGIWNKYVCMQIRDTFFMYCALAVHESTLDLWQCVCIIAGLGWVDLC